MGERQGVSLSQVLELISLYLLHHVDENKTTSIRLVKMKEQQSPASRGLVLPAKRRHSERSRFESPSRPCDERGRRLGPHDDCEAG